MSTEHPDKKYVRRHPLRRLSIAAGVTAILLLAVVAIIALPLANTQWQIDAEIRRIRSVGEPVTSADLAEMYGRLPHEEEATELWLQGFDAVSRDAYTDEAIEVLPIVGFGEEKPQQGEPWPHLSIAETFLEQQATALNLFHRATGRKGDVRFPIDLSPGSKTVKDLRGRVGVAARLLALEAEVHIYKEDATAAAQSVAALLAVGRPLESVPVSSALLYRSAVDNLAFYQLRQLLGVFELPDATLSSLQHRLGAIRYKEIAQLSLLALRVDDLQMIENPSLAVEMLETGSIVVGSGGFLFGEIDFLLWRRRSGKDFRLYLEWMRRLIDVAEKPLAQAWQGSVEIADELNRTKNLKAFGSARFPFSTEQIGLAHILLMLTVRETARIRTIDTAIAVARYERRHGELPERLDQLVPDFLPKVPDDPFTGEPLRYLIEENGYVVYSVGPDGVDDGGKSDDSRGPDLVFRISRPSAD